MSGSAVASLFTMLQARQNDPNAVEDQGTPYGYTPTKWVCILFIVLFGFSTLAHLGQSIRYRMWFLLPSVVLGGCGEVLGWSGRLWSTMNMNLDTPFMIQISTTILSPTFILAANFIIFGRIVNLLGDSYSRLRPRLYGIIFITCDVTSLIIQGIGGGMASSAETDDAAATGANVMLGGIVFQLVLLVCYIFLSAEFYIRYLKNKPFMGRANAGERAFLERPTKILSCALAFNTLCLFIRAIYRTIELSGGWNGRVITTQVYFNVLDGAMVVLAIYTFNIIHPGAYLLPSRTQVKEVGFGSRSPSQSV